MSARPPNTEKVRPLPCVMKEGKGAMSGVRGTAYVPTSITDTVDTGPAELLPGEVGGVKQQLPIGLLVARWHVRPCPASLTSHDAVVEASASTWLRKS